MMEARAKGSVIAKRVIKSKTIYISTSRTS